MTSLVEMLSKDSLANWEKREPKPGIRHNTETKWVRHRFPVNGGFTASQVIEHQVSNGNAVLSFMDSRAKLKAQKEMGK